MLIAKSLTDSVCIIYSNNERKANRSIVDTLISFTVNVKESVSET